MSLIVWKQTFSENPQTPLKNAAVYVYLSGTTTPAMVYDSNSVARNTVPQAHTDVTGYVQLSTADDQYEKNQTFDINAVPDAMFNPDAHEEDFRLKGVQFVKDSGQLIDQSDVFKFDPVTGFMQWEGYASMGKSGANELEIQSPSNGLTTVLRLGGPVTGATFGMVELVSQTSIDEKVGGGTVLQITTTYHSPVANNALTSGQADYRWKDIYSCNAVTVAACSPAPGIAIDEESAAQILVDLEAIDCLKDEKGEPLIGPYGMPQIDFRTVPIWMTNKATLYESIRANAIRKYELQTKLIAASSADEAAVFQTQIDQIKTDAAPDVYWEDFCKAWDEGVYLTRGAGMKADPASISILMALKREIDVLKAEVQSLKNPVSGGL